MGEDEVIKLLEALTQERGERTRRCLSEAELAAYAENQLEGRAKARVEEHVADCRFCLEQIGFLLWLREGEAPEAVPPGLEARARVLGGRKPSLRPAYRWGAMAAATAGVAALVLLRARPPETPVPPSPPVAVPSVEAPTTVATPEPPAVRSRSIGPSRPEQVFPRPDAAVRREDLEFRWRPVPRSLFYEVRLATEEGDLVWAGRASATSLRPPKELRLEGGQRYFVWVRAHLPEGRTIQSRAVAFTVQGGG